jgi:hypothetical protein
MKRKIKRKRFYEQLEPADEKELGRLVNKYGRPRIAEWALTVQRSRMGRPIEPTEREKAALNTIAIEQMIEALKERGRRRAADDVARIIYWHEYRGRKGDTSWKKFLGSFKRDRPRARRRAIRWANSPEAAEWGFELEDEDAKLKRTRD